MDDLTLFSDLAARLDGEVCADAVYRSLLATDGSIFAVQPACVVYPKHREDVVRTVRFARSHGLTIHPRGAGSGLCGSALGSGIVIDFTRHMNRLVHMDLSGKTFTCEPGFRFGELQARLRGTGLFFPPDPSSGEYATFGGMVGTNASGAHSVKYGNTADYLLDADVVVGSGQCIGLAHVLNTEPGELPEALAGLYDLYSRHRAAIETAYPPVRYNSNGYNLRGMVAGGRLDLRRLFTGAEGTLGVVTRLTFRLAEKPAADSLVVAFFDRIGASAEAVRKLLPMGPSGIEIMDKSLLELARESEPLLRRQIPAGVDNVLLIEFDGADRTAVTDLAKQAASRLDKAGLATSVHLAVSAAEKEKFWAVRIAAVPILYKLKGNRKILALIEDAAVPTDRISDYVEGLYGILNRHGVRFVLYGHIAKGLIHTRPLLNLMDAGDVDKLRVLADAVFELVHSLGGAISGEHGDGRLRSAYVQRQYPEIYPLFLKVKQLLDPHGLFNPEIITVHDPDQMKKSLRFGAGYTGSDLPAKQLNWPEGFVREIEKCHGCAKCTTVTTATRMCPIYKFTRDEAAAPKAKANVLRALSSGALADDRLYDAAFQAVMAYCVNCGSCYRECPSNVNIPKMALEARAQYAAHKGAPVADHVTARPELAGRLSRKLMPVARPLSRLRASRRMLERFTGLSARRNPVLPAVRSLFDRTAPLRGNGPTQVVYFAGCYAGYIRPEIGLAAIRVLTRLGMTVRIPEQHCCGLPLISKGMAEAAAAKIRANLRRWGALLDRADHIVVTCSSCGLSLMREWACLVPRADIAGVEKKIVHISRLIADPLGTVRLAPYPARAAYHMPCHLNVQPDPNSSLSLLARIPGFTVSRLESHCCGMAGSWGMLAKNVALSMAIGSDLMEKLDASGAEMAVTDCPTCRIQMEQMGGTPVRHPVEILARSI